MIKHHQTSRRLLLATAASAVGLMLAMTGCARTERSFDPVTIQTASEAPSASQAPPATSASPTATNETPAPMPTSAQATNEEKRTAQQLQLLLTDVAGPHDAVPRGIPADEDYAKGSVATAYGQFKQYGAFDIWGLVYSAVGNTRYDVRVQARDPRAYFLMPEGWVRAPLPSGAVGALNAGYWSGDFDPNQNTPAAVREEADGGYSVSLQGLTQLNRDTFHFWWEGLYPRITIPDNAQGILVHAQMRLIPETASDTVEGAKFIGSISGDLFSGPDVDVDASGTNPELANPRLRYLTDKWSTYYSSTLTVDQLRANPPPL